jgi:hypothetical protein
MHWHSKRTSIRRTQRKYRKGTKQNSVVRTQDKNSTDRIVKETKGIGLETALVAVRACMGNRACVLSTNQSDKFKKTEINVTFPKSLKNRTRYVNDSNVSYCLIWWWQPFGVTMRYNYVQNVAHGYPMVMVMTN